VSFKFNAMGVRDDVVAQLEELASEPRLGQDSAGREIADVLAAIIKTQRVFVPAGQQLSYVVQAEGIYGGGNALELRISVGSLPFTPARRVNPDEANPALAAEISKAMEYSEGSSANHPQPTEENTDPRLLEKRKQDALGQTGGIIGDDAGVHIMEF